MKSIVKERGQYAGRGGGPRSQQRVILAMANYPSYDPNRVTGLRPASGSEAPAHNSAIQGCYPIGSTFKMVTGTAARRRVIAIATLLPRVITRMVNWACYRRAAHGSVNFYRGIAASCNIYYQVGCAPNRCHRALRRNTVS